MTCFIHCTKPSVYPLGTENMYKAPTAMRDKGYGGAFFHARHGLPRRQNEHLAEISKQQTEQFLGQR